MDLILKDEYSKKLESGARGLAYEPKFPPVSGWRKEYLESEWPKYLENYSSDLEVAKERLEDAKIIEEADRRRPKEDSGEAILTDYWGQ
ncbi:MAG: hypothetical protein ACYC9Q_09010 [Bacillota bacterium]